MRYLIALLLALFIHYKAISAEPLKAKYKPGQLVSVVCKPEYEEYTKCLYDELEHRTGTVINVFTSPNHRGKIGYEVKFNVNGRINRYDFIEEWINK